MTDKQAFSHLPRPHTALPARRLTSVTLVAILRLDLTRAAGVKGTAPGGALHPGSDPPLQEETAILMIKPHLLPSCCQELPWRSPAIYLSPSTAFIVSNFLFEASLLCQQEYLYLSLPLQAPDPDGLLLATSSVFQSYLN